MQYWRVILPLAIAYGCLLLASNTALYFLEIDQVEEEMSQATRAAMAAALVDYPDFDLEVSFEGRRGHIGGLAPSVEALRAARGWVMAADEGGIADLPLGHGGLTHTFKARSSFELKDNGGVLELKAFLPEMALERVFEGVRRARDQEPVLLVPEGAEGERFPGASEDAARALWQESLDRFVHRFFKWGRADNAGMYLVDGRELVLMGEVRSDEEKEDVISAARASFPGLALSRLDDRIDVVPRVLPVQIQINADGVISAEGMVPSVEIEERLFERIRSQGAPGQEFANALQVFPDSPDLAWLTDEGPTFFRSLFAAIENFDLAIGQDLVIVRGRAPSQEVADRLKASIEAELGDHEVRARFEVLSLPEAPSAEPPRGD